MSIAKDGADAVGAAWRIPEWFPDISADQLAKLKKYHDELLRFNRSLNLIGVKTIPLADAIHFADSIIACRAISKSASIAEIHDFGSGNGFPGLVYAILFPATKVKLVEADAKKSEFLKHVAATTKLTNVEVITRTVESLPEGSVSYALARGYGPIALSILNTRKIFKSGGAFFHMKSEEWAKEIADIPSQLCSYWQPSALGEYKLPIGEIRFAVVKTTKIKD
ncbi:MAG: 16S rRNA (guanine(527)-N(7))-methyltransferase RsmG [Pseudobdellovibrionaceae bacterium]